MPHSKCSMCGVDDIHAHARCQQPGCARDPCHGAAYRAWEDWQTKHYTMPMNRQASIDGFLAGWQARKLHFMKVAYGLVPAEAEGRNYFRDSQGNLWIDAGPGLGLRFYKPGAVDEARFGPWEDTPWLWQLFGAPHQRRRTFAPWQLGGSAGGWEYCHGEG